MKSAGVFVGGLTSVLTCNLIMIGICSSAPMVPSTPPASVPLPVPAPIVRIEAARIEPQSEPLPWGTFICNGHISLDPEGAIALPICFNR
jgi:hypothetical protein